MFNLLLLFCYHCFYCGRYWPKLPYFHQISHPLRKGPDFTKSSCNESICLHIRISIHLATTKHFYEHFCPSIHPSIRPPVYDTLLSVLSIVSFWSFLGSLPLTRGVHTKCQDHRVQKQFLPIFERFPTVTPVWIHRWLQNDAQSWE